MRGTGLLFWLLAISSVQALQVPQDEIERQSMPSAGSKLNHEESGTDTRTSSTPRFFNSKVQPFAVNGSSIPEIDFDLGESYAGSLSVDDDTTSSNRLFFWFWPSTNHLAESEITVWLNGGPGCSSMKGLSQENGPFLWQSGTYKPVLNPYSWTNLTNMVYVDQPIGTGFSTAAPGASDQVKNQDDVAEHFMGFWKNFVDLFDLHGRKVFLTGESYAGQFVPYIASHMLKTSDSEYFRVAGVLLNNPSINHPDMMIEAPSVSHLNAYANLFGLNESTMAHVNAVGERCGYLDFMDQALAFPPTGKLPAAPDSSRDGCKVWGEIITAALYINPCFNVYHITDFCPYLWNILDFPGMGWGPSDYFNRTDVQMAIHAPPIEFHLCGNENLGLITTGDQSLPSALGPLPFVIEHTNNVIIGHGWLDFLLFANGTLATIQNMTWNGLQGFQKMPKDHFFVPYHIGLAEVIHHAKQHVAPLRPATRIAGAGYMGITHTERGLTFVTVNQAGHELPQYAPGAAYRELELLLGRIDNLSQEAGFTTQSGDFQDRTLPKLRAWCGEKSRVHQDEH